MFIALRSKGGFMVEGNTADIDSGSSRRQFMIGATGILTFLCTVVLGIPLVGSFIGSAFRRSKTRWIDVAELTDLPAGQPVSLTVIDVQTDAYLQESTVRRLWVVRHSDNGVTVFSPTCTHLGCQYNWNSVSGHFECPCHGSVYAQDGSVLGGPAPRRLDTLSTRIEKGRLSVDWQQFRSGIREKIAV
jgi:menaquinol-cytochrome c reductase iron-sulfur subunit